MDSFPIAGLILQFDNGRKVLVVIPKTGKKKEYVLQKREGVSLTTTGGTLEVTLDNNIGDMSLNASYALSNGKLEFSFMVTPVAKVIGITDFEGSFSSSSSINLNLDVVKVNFLVKGASLNISAGRKKEPSTNLIGK